MYKNQKLFYPQINKIQITLKNLFLNQLAFTKYGSSSDTIRYRLGFIPLDNCRYNDYFIPDEFIDERDQTKQTLRAF